MQSQIPQPELSVVIPAFNEAERIGPTIKVTSEYLTAAAQSFELIVVDDGSTDSTLEVLSKLQSETPELRFISLPGNRGKGAAVRSGVMDAKGDLILYIDADGATPIAELSKLMDAIAVGSDIAIGSRALPSAETKIVSKLHRKLLGRIFNFAVNLIAVPGLLDTQCGFKLFKRHAAKKIFERQLLNGFSFDVEVLYLARRLDFKVKEVAVNWNNQPGTKVNVVKDGILMLLDVFKLPFLHMGK